MDKFNDMNKYLYLLPNTITTLALLGGFFAILAAINHYFMWASAGIFIAGVADMLDGRIARLTKTQSEFGNKFDSLSDLVAFGVAPTITVYLWSLYRLGVIGAIIAFFYLFSAAFRLARFSSVQATQQDPAYFAGMPTPPMAAVVAGIVWFGQVYQIPGELMAPWAGGLMIAFAIMMASRLRYFSFKTLSLKKNPYFFIASLIFMLSSTKIIGLPETLFIGVFCYFLSGPLGVILQLLRVSVR